MERYNNEWKLFKTRQRSLEARRSCDYEQKTWWKGNGGRDIEQGIKFYQSGNTTKKWRWDNSVERSEELDQTKLSTEKWL